MNTSSEQNMVSPFQLFEGETAENPFPLLAQLRVSGPIAPFPLPFDADHQVWLVSRLEEAVLILKEKRFSVDSAAVDANSIFPSTRQHPLIGQSMIAVDEPDHRRLRGMVSKVFTPRYIQGLRPQIQQIADDLIDKIQERGQMDLVSEYAYPLPINVISDMMGVPDEDRDAVRSWSEAITEATGSASQHSDPRIAAFHDYSQRLIAEKRRHPQDDLISQLVRTEEAGDRLSEGELLSMVALLIFAGHETTSSLIGIGSLMLLDHPDQLAKVKADLSLVPSLVEELLRFNSPVLAPAPRFATEDVEINGQVIHRGDMILTMLASANRDEQQFSDPDDLHIARTLNHHIAFGQGIHICLGAPLARLEGDIAFTTLLKRLPNLRLADERSTVKWRGSFSLRGVTSLPVVF